jgi:putative membrane protein
MQAGEAQPSRRLHWSYLLSSLGSSIKTMWGFVAGGAFLAFSGQLMWVAPVMLASIVATIVAAFVRWRTFSYTLDADEIHIRSGLLNRTHRSIPFDRIQDVDISQGPLARILGTASAKLETGAASGSSEDGILAAVLLEEAEQVRRTIRERRAGVPTAIVAGAESDAFNHQPLYAMDTRRLLLAGLFNFSLALFAGLIGASQTFGDLVGFDPFDRSFWRELGDVFGPLSAFLLAHRVTAAISGALLLAVLGLASGIVRTVLREYGFRLDRSETGIRRRRGLLTKTDVTLQVRRVQAAVETTGPVRDCFGWRALKLQSLAQDGDTKDDHVVAPLATRAEVDDLLQEIGIGKVSKLRSWQSVSAAYLFAFVLATSPVYLIAAGQALSFWWLGLLTASAVALAQGMRWLAWKRTAFALDGGRLLIRTGWWARRLSVLPVRNIQSIDLTENFVTRLFGTSALHFGVAGGTGHRIPAVPRETALQVRHQLLSQGA